MSSHNDLFVCRVDDAADASAINEMGLRACKQALISKGSNSAPSNSKLRPGMTTSLLSTSSDSGLVAVDEGKSSKGLVAASYTGVSA